MIWIFARGRKLRWRTLILLAFCGFRGLSRNGHAKAALDCSFPTPNICPGVQGLRAAYERAPAGAFEDLLRGADGADGRAGGGGGAGRLAGAVHTNDVTLLRRPSVFTLAVGWESVQARLPLLVAHQK